MNEVPSNPPAIPLSQLSTLGPAPGAPGANPDDQLPITGFVAAFEAILRQPRRVLFQLRQPGAGRLIASMLAVSMLCSLVYGIVVGTFSGGTQLWAAPLKITSGVLISVLICLPSLYIFSCLSGSAARLVEVFG